MKEYLESLKLRARNYGFWVSLSSAVLIVLQLFGVAIVPEQWNAVVNALLTVLVILGIVNNPATENKGFLDDKK